MATYLALRKQDEQHLNSIKFVILLGGVPPHIEDKQVLLLGNSYLFTS
jgi:hypothetical protein